MHRPVSEAPHLCCYFSPRKVYHRIPIKKKSGTPLPLQYAGLGWTWNSRIPVLVNWKWNGFKEIPVPVYMNMLYEILVYTRILTECNRNMKNNFQNE